MQFEKIVLDQQKENKIQLQYLLLNEIVWTFWSDEEFIQIFLFCKISENFSIFHKVQIDPTGKGIMHV